MSKKRKVTAEEERVKALDEDKCPYPLVTLSLPQYMLLSVMIYRVLKQYPEPESWVEQDDLAKSDWEVELERDFKTHTHKAGCFAGMKFSQLQADRAFDELVDYWSCYHENQKVSKEKKS